MFLDADYADRLADLQLMARVWWVIAAGTLLLLTVLAVRTGARREAERRISLLARLRTLHRSVSATASMEYLLVLFPFLVIVMTVWQLAFMFNAQLHVGYAAYAAARSASVMVTANLEAEEEGVVKKQGDAKATKWARIRKAAIPGTIGISPGNWQAAGGVALASSIKKVNLGAFPDPAGISRLALLTVHHGRQSIYSGTRPQRALVKNLYAEKMTEVLINDKKNTEQLDLPGADTVTVTVNYVFWLHVPYVGGLLEAMFEGREMLATGKYKFLNPYPSMVLSETITMTSWPRRRAIEPCSG